MCESKGGKTEILYSCSEKKRQSRTLKNQLRQRKKQQYPLSIFRKIQNDIRKCDSGNNELQLPAGRMCTYCIYPSMYAYNRGTVPCRGQKCGRCKWPAPPCPAWWPGSSHRSPFLVTASTGHTSPGRGREEGTMSGVEPAANIHYPAMREACRITLINKEGTLERSDQRLRPASN